MRHPRVAAVGAVLDHDQPPARAQHRVHGCHNVALVAEKVQRVGHDDAVETGKWKRAPEVGDPDVERCRRVPPPHLLGEPAQGATVAIDRVDVSARTEQLGQRQREGSLPGTQVGPFTALGVDALAQKADQLTLM